MWLWDFLDPWIRRDGAAIVFFRMVAANWPPRTQSRGRIRHSQERRLGNREKVPISGMFCDSKIWNRVCIDAKSVPVHL